MPYTPKSGEALYVHFNPVAENLTCETPACIWRIVGLGFVLTKRTEESGQGCGGCGWRHNFTAGRHMVHESTRLSVWSVDRTQEAPGLGQQLPNRGGPHLGECCSSVNAAEVGQVTDEVELVGYNTQASVLQHAKTCGNGKPFKATF